MDHVKRPGTALRRARGWRACALALALLGAACGGGGDGDFTAGGPAGTNAPVASGSGPAIPGTPAAALGTWSVVFSDPAGEAGRGALNRTGGLAYTAVRPEGAHARFFDGSAVHDLQGLPAQAVSVNDGGQVAGHVRPAGGTPRAVRWDTLAGSVARQIDLEPGTASTAEAINAEGVVAVTITRRGLSNVVRWRPGVLLQALQGLGPGAQTSSSARSINTRGDIAGVSTVSGAPARAALWRPDNTVIELGFPGGGESEPTALNDAGQVAGDAVNAAGARHAFLWSEYTGLRDLGTLGGPASTATGLNASGWVVGTSDTADGASVAFLWRDGVMQGLGALGGRSSAASAINAEGLVAGNAETATGVQHAFLWSEATGMVDLNDVVSGAAPGVLQTVVALADDGAVLALAGGTLVLLRRESRP